MAVMARPRPQYLQSERTRHGKIVWYVRIGAGPRIRIKGEYGSHEFMEAYHAAIKGEHPKPKHEAARGTLEWLWLLYHQSTAWTELSLATRKQRENIMKHVLKTAGDKPLSGITRASIVAGRDRRAKTPSQAKNFISTVRGLFSWALEANLVNVDPTAGVKRPKRKRSEGFPVWTDADIAQFERRWPRGTRERVMFDVFLYTGLRRGDAAQVGKQHVSNGCIQIDTEKTGMRVTIPVLPELQATLSAGPVGDLAFIATEKGHPMTKESLGNAFRDACRAAGIKKSAHGLRKAAATNAANHGASEKQLEAVFGWAGGQMASHYTRSANREALSKAAADMLSRDEKETSIPLPGDEVRGSGLKTK